MTDGQFIAVDLDNGKGKRLQVHDVGGGWFTASDPMNGNKVLAVVPLSQKIEWSEAGAAGEWEKFTVDGNIMCFYATNDAEKPNNGNVRLFGFSGNVKGVGG